MIYKKPQDAMHMLDLVVEGGGVLNWVRDVKAFLHSLPAEFEIVQPGMTQVRWPSDCTKGHLEIAARNLSYNAETSEGAAKHMLRALAAIAPEEKKKRKVELWKNQHGSYTLCNPGFKPVEGLSAWERVRTSCPLEVEE